MVAATMISEPLNYRGDTESAPLDGNLPRRKDSV